MGLFGKKKWEEEEVVRDSTPPTSAEEKPKPPAKQPAKTYGIDEVVQLMRKLPSENVELVVRVLNETLESVKIGVKGLVKEAQEREADLSERVARHKAAIAALEEELAAKKKAIEEEIAEKKSSIEQLEANKREVIVVRERLNLGLTLPTPKPLDAVGSEVVVKKSSPPPPPVASTPPTKATDAKPGASSPLTAGLSTGKPAPKPAASTTKPIAGASAPSVKPAEKKAPPPAPPPDKPAATPKS